MATIADAIEAIRKQPLLLGRKSVDRLYAFLAGYAWARKDAQEDDYLYLAGFRRWVHKRFKITSTQGWDDIIIFFGADEADAFALFWKLYDKYLESLSKSASHREDDAEE